jgi:hypothetical protein
MVRGPLHGRREPGTVNNIGVNLVNHGASPTQRAISSWRKDMSKKHNVPALTHAASLAGRAIARMEAQAEEVLAQGTKRQSLQLVASGEQFTALIRHGKTTIQIEGDSFAVTQSN